jgi:hypothetical protein
MAKALQWYAHDHREISPFPGGRKAWVTTREAARLLGVSLSRIGEIRKKGYLKYALEGNSRVWISRRSLDRLREQLAEAGLRSIRLGTIERHGLPVDDFLFSAARGDTVGERGVEVNIKTAVPTAMDRVEETLRRNPHLREVHLFYTGLTEVTVAALLVLLERRLTVILYRYDTASGQYHPYLKWDRGRATILPASL